MNNTQMGHAHGRMSSDGWMNDDSDSDSGDDHGDGDGGSCLNNEIFPHNNSQRDWSEYTRRWVLDWLAG